MRCLRRPYGVLPHGLNTDSVVIVSNTSKPPAAWTTSWTGNTPKSALDDVVAAAARPDMRLTAGMCPSRMRVAMVVSRNFAEIQ